MHIKNGRHCINVCPASGVNYLTDDGGIYANETCRELKRSFNDCLLYIKFCALLFVLSS
jgi:hypothetical protein